jgi:hypothetical protein
MDPAATVPEPVVSFVLLALQPHSNVQSEPMKHFSQMAALI